MKTDAKNRKPQTKRGRRGNGCDACRNRHIKCDEALPICVNCAITGKVCERPCKPDSDEAKNIINTSSRSAQLNASANVLSPLPQVSPVVHSNHRERELLHRCANQLIPLLSARQGSSFWHDCVMLGTNYNDELFHSVIALTTLCEMPLSRTMQPRALLASTNAHSTFQDAIKWYSKSVSSSLAISKGQMSSSKLASVLMNSIIYLDIELRLGNHANAEKLFRTMLSMLHCFRHLLWDCKDSAVLASLLVLLDRPLWSSLDSSTVLKEHRDYALTLSRKIATDLDLLDVHNLRLELIGLVYELHDLVAHENNEAARSTSFDIFFRLETWYHHLVKRERMPDTNKEQKDSFGFMRIVYIICTVQLLSYRDTTSHNQATISVLLETLLAFQDRRVDTWVKSGARTASWVLESGLIPGCLFICWYRRDCNVVDRISRLLNQFQGQDELKDRLITITIDYIKIVAATPYDQATDMELQIFGTKPTTFTTSQQYLLANALHRSAFSA